MKPETYQIRKLRVAGAIVWEISRMRHNPTTDRWEAVETLATVSDSVSSGILLVGIDEALKGEGWSWLAAANEVPS